MGQILCQDILNQIIQHTPYKDRPKALTTNKQIQNLYTKSYLTQDKQTFSNLNDIFKNKKFFARLIGNNYKEFLNTQNHHTINFLHNYAFTKRTMIKENLYDTNRFIIAPLACHKSSKIENSIALQKLKQKQYIIIWFNGYYFGEFDMSYIDIVNHGLSKFYTAQYFFPDDNDPEELYTLGDSCCIRCHIHKIREDQYYTEYINIINSPEAIHMANILKKK